MTLNDQCSQVCNSPKIQSWKFLPVPQYRRLHAGFLFTTEHPRPARKLQGRANEGEIQAVVASSSAS